MSHNTFWLYSYLILSPLIPLRFTFPHLLPTLWPLFFIAQQVQCIFMAAGYPMEGGQPIRDHTFKIKVDSPSPRSQLQLSLAPWSAVVLMSSSPFQAWMLTVLILCSYYSGGHGYTRSMNAPKIVFPSGPPHLWLLETFCLLLQDVL